MKIHAPLLELIKFCIILAVNEMLEATVKLMQNKHKFSNWFDCWFVWLDTTIQLHVNV